MCSILKSHVSPPRHLHTFHPIIHPLDYFCPLAQFLITRLPIDPVDPSRNFCCALMNVCGESNLANHCPAFSLMFKHTFTLFGTYNLIRCRLVFSSSVSALPVYPLRPSAFHQSQVISHFKGIVTVTRTDFLFVDWKQTQHTVTVAGTLHSSTVWRR